ncbi:MAG: LLM class flavin-dependent oxidoreductase [Acidimicrobiia bacterium]
MTVGIGLSVYSGLGPATVPYLDAAAAAFDSLWFPDHLQSNRTGGVMEGWTLLAHALARYPDKTCGHQVLCNEFRHPAVLAKMAATAQILSAGRFVLGIGAGWHREEAEAYGLDFPPTPERIARMDESIELLRLLWTGGSVDHAGRFFSLRGAECAPAPEPVPPVMVGGSGERHLLAVVARQADLWNYIYRDVEAFAGKLRVLHRHCDDVGRAPSAIVPVLGVQILIGSSEREIRRMVENGGARSVEQNGIAGDPRRALDQLLAGIDAGARAIVVGFADSPRTDGTELFVQEVMPGLRLAGLS